MFKNTEPIDCSFRLITVEALGYQTVSLCAEGVKQMVGGEGDWRDVGLVQAVNKQLWPWKSHLVTGLPSLQRESISLVYSVRSHTISPRWPILGRFLLGTKCWGWSPRHRHLHIAKCSAIEFYPKPPEERLFHSLIWYQKETENGRNTGVFILWPPVESKRLHLGELREQGPHPEVEFQWPHVLGMKRLLKQMDWIQSPAMTPCLLLDFYSPRFPWWLRKEKKKSPIFAAGSTRPVIRYVIGLPLVLGHLPYWKTYLFTAHAWKYVYARCTCSACRV